MPPLVELENVVKTYGAAPALGPITLTVPETSVGLLGPNGAGKTTFLRLLMGLIAPSEGTVRVLGEVVRPGAKAIRRRIGYVPEGDVVFPGLSGVEAVAYAGRLVGMSSVEAMQRAHQVLDYVELREERYRLAEKYSTGMRQRLKLAQALVHDPQLLILDEPTEGVDPASRNHLLKLLGELQRDHGMNVLLSTHLLPDVDRLAKYAVVLNEGHVAAQGTLDDLKRAATSGHYVKVTGDVGAFTRRLDEAGVRWSDLRPVLRVDLTDPQAVLEHVRAAGVTVRQISPVTLTLEEAFRQAIAGGA